MSKKNVVVRSPNVTHQQIPMVVPVVVPVVPVVVLVVPVVVLVVFKEVDFVGIPLDPVE
jgi:hypothetical protein|tara:strand:+ start:881 stop:1057 length:177 start_codon:yes stop_codon:yes gene_type:complete